MSIAVSLEILDQWYGMASQLMAIFYPLSFSTPAHLRHKLRRLCFKRGTETVILLFCFLGSINYPIFQLGMVQLEPLKLLVRPYRTGSYSRSSTQIMHLTFTRSLLCQIALYFCSLRTSDTFA